MHVYVIESFWLDETRSIESNCVPHGPFETHLPPHGVPTTARLDHRPRAWLAQPGTQCLCWAWLWGGGILGVPAWDPSRAADQQAHCSTQGLWVSQSCEQDPDTLGQPWPCCLPPLHYNLSILQIPSLYPPYTAPLVLGEDEDMWGSDASMRAKLPPPAPHGK